MLNLEVSVTFRLEQLSDSRSAGAKQCLNPDSESVRNLTNLMKNLVGHVDVPCVEDQSKSTNKYAHLHEEKMAFNLII